MRKIENIFSKNLSAKYDIRVLKAKRQQKNFTPQLSRVFFMSTFLIRRCVIISIINLLSHECNTNMTIQKYRKYSVCKVLPCRPIAGVYFRAPKIMDEKTLRDGVNLMPLTPVFKINKFNDYILKTIEHRFNGLILFVDANSGCLNGSHGS